MSFLLGLRRGAIVFALAATLLVSPFTSDVLFAQGATLVTTSAVQPMEFNEQVTLVGRTEATTGSQIVSEITGRVLKVNAPEGNQVQKGDPLVTIDDENARLQLEAKAAQAAQAKAQTELAETNLKRVEELSLSKNLIPETSLDSMQALTTMYRERYRELEAERKQLARDVRQHVIRAPYDGYTLRKQVDVGEWVNPGTPVYGMVDLAEVLVTVDLPERYYGQLAVGSEALVRVSNDPQPFVGKVTGIARSAGQETHTFPVIVTVQNDGERLAGGKLVRATLSLNETRQALGVSKDAIVRQGPQAIVYTIKDGKAEMIPVEITATKGKFVAIQGPGVSDGLPVIVRGNERIFPGAPVRTGGAPQGQNGQGGGAQAAADDNPTESN